MAKAPAPALALALAPAVAADDDDELVHPPTLARHGNSPMTWWWLGKKLYILSRSVSWKLGGRLHFCRRRWVTT